MNAGQRKTAKEHQFAASTYLLTSPAAQTAARARGFSIAAPGFTADIASLSGKSDTNSRSLFSRHSPDSDYAAILTIFGPPSLQGSLATDCPGQWKPWIRLPCWAETWLFPIIKTHLSYRGPRLSTPKPFHAGAGRARNRVMSIRRSRNTCRGLRWIARRDWCSQK